MTTTKPLSLATAQKRAGDTATAAQALRDRATAGGRVNAADLAAAEAEERLAAIQLEAAQQRAAEQRKVDDTRQLERDRAAVQDEWAAAQTPDAAVQRLLDVAVAAAVEYLQAAQARAYALAGLHDRAGSLGFEVDAYRSRRSPLPDLATAILAGARDVLPQEHTTPRYDTTPIYSVWGS